MIGGILFIVLSVVLAGISGFSACLGILIGDPVMYNRLSLSFWYDTLMGLFMSKGSREITMIAALGAVISFWVGLVCLV